MNICTNLTKIATLSIATMFVLSCSKIDNFVPENPGNKTYSITIGGNTDDSGTRAVYDGVTYKWEPNDHIGLFMSRNGVSSYTLSNIPMAAMCTTPSVTTYFTGTVSASDISGISGRSDYHDFYSYFPYQAGADCNTYPIVKWTMPSVITLQKGVFNYNYAPQVANKVSSWEPITWIEGGSQQSGQRVSFQYNHLMSFIKLELTYNLNGSPITQIKMESTNGVYLSGIFNIDLETGTGGYAPGSSTSLTINIQDGLEVNTSGNEYIYIPVPPGANTFKLTFTNDEGEVIKRATISNVGGTITEGEKTINATFVKKNIHRMGVGVPGYIDFTDPFDLKSKGLEGVSPGTNGRTFKGFTLYTGGGSGNAVLRDHHVELSSPLFASHANEGVLKISPFNITNTLGKANFNVDVSIYGCGFATVMLASNRQILVNATTVSNYNLPANTSPYFGYSYYATNTWGWERYMASNTSGITIASNSYLTFHISSATTVSANGRIQKIWVIPQ